MDRLGEVVAGPRGGEFGQRVLGAAGGDAADPVVDPLPALETVGHALPLPASAVPTRWLPLAGQTLVRVAPVAGHLSAEPARRQELAALALGGKLDLGDDQSLQSPLIDVDLGLEAVADRDHSPDLRQPAAGGQRPELLELPLADRQLDLLTDLATPALDGQQALVAAASQPHLNLIVDRQVPLLDPGSDATAEPVRSLGEQELALDLLRHALGT